MEINRRRKCVKTAAKSKNEENIFRNQEALN